MAKNSAIEWTDHTFNPWEGCTKISPACDNCYAAERAARYKTVEWGGPRRRTSKSNWNKPLKWERQASTFAFEEGRRQRVFCASLADVFDNQVPEEWRADLWDLIRACPSLDWLLLTKRPQNIEKMLPEFWDEIKGRIWLGTTVENQEVAERNIPHLLKHDSAVRFLSIEPILEAIELENYININSYELWPLSGEVTDMFRPFKIGFKVDWVIAGGESGRNARPASVSWIRSLRDQCRRQRTPFLFKQWGEWAPVSHHMQNASNLNFDWRTRSVRVGKKKAGRYLDGLEHTEFPNVERL